MSKCRIKADGCHGTFVKRSISQKCCNNTLCAIALVAIDKAKKERRKQKEDKVKLRPRSQWIQLAQAAFNAFVRARDKGRNCICCNRPLSTDAIGGEFDCGHYRSVGSAPHLRYNEDNAHGQSKQCNRWGSGRAVDYRLGLVARIGIERVEALEADQIPIKHSIPELQELISIYKHKTKQLGGINEISSASIV